MTRPLDQEAERAAEEIRKGPIKSVWLVIQDDPHAVTLDIDGVPRVLHHGHHNLTWLLPSNRESESEKTLREALEALADHAGKTWCAVCDDHAAGCDELRAARAALDSVRRVSIVDKNR